MPVFLSSRVSPEWSDGVFSLAPSRFRSGDPLPVASHSASTSSVEATAAQFWAFISPPFSHNETAPRLTPT